MSRKPVRQKLADERRALTHKFGVGSNETGWLVEGYITVGEYEDGRPGEVFITIANATPFLKGWVEAFAKSVSLLLQYGVPLGELLNTFQEVEFDGPEGMAMKSSNRELPQVTSVIDYFFRWIELRFLEGGKNVKEI